MKKKIKLEFTINYEGSYCKNCEWLRLPNAESLIYCRIFGSLTKEFHGFSYSTISHPDCIMHREKREVNINL